MTGKGNEKLHSLVSQDLHVRFLTACLNGDLENVIDALELHADVNRTGLGNLTGLMHAAKEGHVEVVEILVARDDCDINQSDEDGETAFSLVCRRGIYSVAKILLNCDVLDINTVDVSMMTSLHKAISNNHVDIVQLLLEHSEFNVNSPPLDITLLNVSFR